MKENVAGGLSPFNGIPTWKEPPQLHPLSYNHHPPFGVSLFEEE